MLDVQNLSCQFNALIALQEVSFSLEAGEMLGLIGPNGSGKSTLFNVVTGLYSASNGDVRFQDRRLGGSSVHEIAALGIARSFQTPRLYNRLSVLENLQSAGIGARRLRNVTRVADSESLLRRAGLYNRRHDLASDLSLPDRRRLELVRAHIAHPKLILLDEPAGGMTPAETGAMAELIASLRQADQSCILIEHKMTMVQSLCQRTIVLNFGRKIADGPTNEVLRSEAVIDAYLGVDDDR